MRWYRPLSDSLQIYEYNVDAVVECCLPWHDTVAFARMVQLLSLKGSRCSSVYNAVVLSM